MSNQMRLLTNRSKLLLLTFAFYLSGCATISSQQTAAPPAHKPSVMHKQHMAQIEKIETFSLKGRLGVITKPKGFSGRISWNHLSDKDNIDVFSPIGSKVANISKTQQQVVLTDNKGKSMEAPDAETLTEDALGFRLPLSGLSQWALGKPSTIGLANYVSWDEYGRIKNIKQNGWDIQYKNYATKGNVALPGKIFLKNDRLTLKLLVEEWVEVK